jgi:hypothetical protein
MTRRLSHILPSALIVLFVLGYLLTAYLTLDATTRRVPVLTGFVTLALLAMDILRSILAGENRARSAEVSKPLPRGREITAILFVAGGVAGIYFIGFLAAVPLYLIISIAYLGAQPMRTAIIVALIASVSIYLIFDVALAYRLFQGILFF